GNNNNASLSGSTSFSPGVSGNAISFSGGFAQLPNNITSSLSDFTIAAWVNISSLANWERIFDFGSGTSKNMFLTPDAGGSNNLRFAITNNGNNNEQQLNGPALNTNTWYHIAVTLSGTTATLYLNGQPINTNNNMTLHPSSLGNTTQNYLAKSQYPDPAFSGSIDDFRLYPLALNAQQILELATPTVITPANTPTPNTLTNTANLSILATDVTAGEPALIYTWSTLGTPPAPVTFSDNATNSAKNTTATFSKSGHYTLQVSITNPLTTLTTTSTMTLNVLPGDANQDNKIDLTDLSIVLNNFGKQSPLWTDGNFDGAPTINLTDLSFVLNNFGASLPAPAITPTLITTTSTPTTQSPTPTPAPTTLPPTTPPTTTNDITTTTVTTDITPILPLTTPAPLHPPTHHPKPKPHPKQKPAHTKTTHPKPHFTWNPKYRSR
ncbi:MAG: LamG-like jellyroll fold domain-containing protein, partial [Phycisphaerae bacterium]